MTKIYIIILSIFIFSNGTDICECAPVPNWKKATPKEFEYVKDVFIGDVTICDNTEFEIKVCEVFKGNLKAGEIIKGENIGYCGPYVDKNGEWVLFGNYSNNFKVNDFEYDEKTVLKKWKAESKKMIKEQIKMLREISKSK